MGSNIYCILLNIIEGIGFKDFHSHGIILKLSLNGVKFEVEGIFSQPNVITFNNNCIWECELDDIKRIKMDNLPIKLECFFTDDDYKNGSTMHMGSLLITLRGVKILNSTKNFQAKPYWYKLSNLSPEFRQKAPQLLLRLSIVNKSMVEHIYLETNWDNQKSTSDNLDNTVKVSSYVTHTVNMLQSQHGIYIKLLDELGQIQVGNDPIQDCDIFCVTLTFRQIRNVLNLIKSQSCKKKSFIFQYDLLGSTSNINIVLNNNDSYIINQKISLCFRSSLKSLQFYFQRVFYIPIHLYYISDIPIAKYNFEISSFIPENINYFNEKELTLWRKYGSFCFDVFKEVTSPGILQPLVEFMLTLELLTKSVNRSQSDISQYGYTTSHVKSINQVMENKVDNYLELQQPLLENVALTQSNTEANDVPKTSYKSVRTIAVNTDEYFSVQESDNIYFYFLHQFNKWKQHQFKYFMRELVQVNNMYFQKLQMQWDNHKNLLISCLVAKIKKCDQILLHLENYQTQQTALADICLKIFSTADKVSKELESSYKLKITKLKTEIQYLTRKIQEKEAENTILKKRTDHYEKKLEICKKAHLYLKQLKEVLNDMRNQADRYMIIDDFYKEQYANYMHILKVKLLQQVSSNADINFSLGDIHNEEVITFQIDDNTSFKLSDISFSNSNEERFL